MSIPFEEWITGARFYLNFDRYGNFKSNFVVASRYSEDEQLESDIEDLDGGDPEMIMAMERLRNRSDVWFGVGVTPSEAFADIEAHMRDYHKALSDR